MKGKTIFVSLIIFCLLFANFMSVNTRSELEEDPLVQGWSKDIRLTNDSADSMHPSIAVDSSGIIHVVWQDHRDDLWGVYYDKSSDMGITWSESRRINALTNSGQAPQIAIGQNDIIHVVWAGATQEEPYSEIYYKNSTDGGNTWSEDIRLTYAPDDSGTPTIVTWESYLHLIWAEKMSGNYEIYYMRSKDKGNSWEGLIRLTSTPDKSIDPSVAVDPEGNVHVVWKEEGESSKEVYYIKGVGAGSDWGESLKLADANGGWWVLPQIVADSKENIHVIWEGGDGEREIFYRRWVENNGSWLSIEKITPSPYESHYPALTIDSNDNLYTIWCDYRHAYTNSNFTGNGELYYRKTTETGTIWGDETRLTNASGMSWDPAITVDSKNILHVVWMDYRDGNKEIYYKRTLNPVTEPPIIVTQILNISTCKPGNSVTVSGNAVYDDSIVPNANVTIKILETGDEWNTTTDSNGNYTITITAPSTPGNYTITTTVTYGNLTGTKYAKLTVESEPVINDGGTNDEQQDSREEDIANIIYLVMVGVLAGWVIVAFVLLRMRKTGASKVEKVKEERKPGISFPRKIQTMSLRCPGCKMMFSVKVKPKPFGVKCPYCGKEGAIR